MSLQLWFPFTKDDLNRGSSNGDIVKHVNIDIVDGGKLGKCCLFDADYGTYMTREQDFLSNSTSDWTLACWIKLNSTRAGQTLFSCRTGVNSTGFTVIYYGTSWIVDDGVRWQPSASLSANTWYHVCIIRKKGIGKFIYINGVLDKETTTTGTPTTASSTHYSIGASQSTSSTVSGNYFGGYMNDFRFYDHAISQAEIKELSKGLVVHYKLDDFMSSSNLLVNGFGELGNENWTNTNISTTEIPPDHPEIKASFYNSNMMKEYIPVCRTHRYTITGYIKALSGKTGNSYPSIFPYDYDKKFIAAHNSRIGFDSATLTTLSQPLNKGDTVIHATDLSKWHDDSTSYYFHVAIFGYKNSKGYVYPDLEYTNDSPSFGSRTNKSNLDKTTNTITLLSAYNGESRPAGTSICQATEGATYYYPWGGVNLANVTNWTYKTATFTPSKNTRLSSAEYFRWQVYSNLYIAGSKMFDNFLVSSKITDSSGYGNHGTSNGNISLSYNSARYDISTVFDGTSAYIEADPLPPETKTISIWVKTSYVTAPSYQLVVHDKNTGLGIGWASNQLITYVGTSNGSTGSRIDITTTNYTANQWNHIVVVKTGDKTRDVYVNGILATPSSVNYWAGDLVKLNIGNRHMNGSYSAYFKGQLSDFRAYATALSEDDILSLYNVCARVANSGAIMGYQMKEG